MAHSSLLGIDEVPGSPPGTTPRRSPSDTSDSGSDVAGLADLDDGDPGLPVDFATSLDSGHPDTSFEAIGDGSDSDSAGTGERRSAGGDAGLREARRHLADRVVFDPNTGEPARRRARRHLPTIVRSAREAGVECAVRTPARRLLRRGRPGPWRRRRKPGRSSRVPGGSHPKAQGPAKPHGHHPSRRERDHGLTDPSPTCRSRPRRRARSVRRGRQRRGRRRGGGGRRSSERPIRRPSPGAAPSGSTGLTRCASKPALRASCTSRSWP